MSSPSSADVRVDPYRMENPYTPEALARQRKRQRRILRLASIVAALVIAAGSCYLVWDTVRPPEIGSYATQEITLEGLAEGTIVLTPQDLADMDCVRMTASGAQANGGVSKAGIVSAYGPSLESVLKQHGYTQTDFRRIKLYCRDGYTVVLRGESLEYDVVLSIASGKDALPEAQQPLRCVIPDEQSGKWAYGVVRIECDI